MDIHHKDGNKDNNEIENLQMLSRSDHLKEHGKCPLLRKERRKTVTELIIFCILYYTKIDVYFLK